MSIRKFITSLTLTIVSIMALTSCGETDSPYISGVCGTWKLYSVNGIPVSYYEQDIFVFNDGYDSGDGIYGVFFPAPTPEGYHWSENRIFWRLDFDRGGNYLIVDTWNGAQWVYQFVLTGWTLELYDTYNGNILVYNRI